MRLAIAMLTGLMVLPAMAVSESQLQAASYLYGRMMRCTALKPDSYWPIFTSVQRDLADGYRKSITEDEGDGYRAATIMTRAFQSGMDETSTSDCTKNSPDETAWFMEHLRSHQDNANFFRYINEKIKHDGW